MSSFNELFETLNISATARKLRLNVFELRLLLGDRSNLSPPSTLLPRRVYVASTSCPGSWMGRNIDSLHTAIQLRIAAYQISYGHADSFEWPFRLLS